MSEVDTRRGIARVDSRLCAGFSFVNGPLNGSSRTYVEPQLPTAVMLIHKRAIDMAKYEYHLCGYKDASKSNDDVKWIALFEMNSKDSTCQKK